MHILAIVGLTGLVAGSTKANWYFVVPLVHGGVALVLAPTRRKTKETWFTLIAVGVSAIFSLGAAIAAALDDPCDGWQAVVANALMIATGLLTDRSFSVLTYYNLIEAALILLVVAANPLEFESRTSHFTWWGKFLG